MAQRQANPADESNEPTVQERRRVPFSVPTPRLAVPEIPGYHLHWFIGTPGRIDRALQAGYEFVEQTEVRVNNHLLGSETAEQGSTDMGTRVSIAAGGEIELGGQAARLYLMKIKEEWWQEDQKAAIGPGSRLEGVRQALLSGMLGREGQRNEDNAQVYVDTKRTAIPDYLNPNKRRKT